MDVVDGLLLEGVGELRGGSGSRSGPPRAWDATLADPIKRRGTAFTYNQVHAVLSQLYQTP